MVYNNEDSGFKKEQEYRNLAEFTNQSVEEIKYLDLYNHQEYLKIYTQYKSWCINLFNMSCNEFNEKEKAKMQKYSSKNYSSDSGLTA